MNVPPLVSAVMSTYNGSPFIEFSVQSVLAQTYLNWELIVVDDGSTDDVIDLVRRLADPRIKTYQNAERMGLAVSLNRGIARTRGEFIARIDDDDVWADRDKLKRQVEFMMTHKRVGLCGAQNRVIDTAGRKLYDWKVATTDSDIRKNILHRNQFVHSGVMIRRSTLEKSGLYDSAMRYAQDYELWLRIGMRSRLANLEDIYVEQRINPRGITGKNNLRQFIYFVRIAWRYRNNYPGFWGATPMYLREFLVNLIPKRIFFRLSHVWRRFMASRDI